MSLNTDSSFNERLAFLQSCLEQMDGISTIAVMALITITQRPGISVNELAELLRVPQQSASRCVSVLLGRYSDIGEENLLPVFISQTINENDPRKRSLAPTAAGIRFLTKMLNKQY